MNYNIILQLIISASASNLLLTSFWFHLGIYSDSTRYFFYEKPAHELILGVLIFFLFWILIFISLEFLKIKKLIKTESFFKFIIIILICDILRKISGYLPLSFINENKSILILLITLIITSIILIKFHKFFNKIFTFFFIILSPFIFLNIANILNFNFLLNWDNNKTLIKKKNYTEEKDKIILIIFDELDSEFLKKDAYEAFNNFINTSDLYSNTSTVGYGTLSNIISIISGSKLNKIIPTNFKDYKFKNNNIYFKYQNKEISLSEYKNIFKTLNNKKYKVGIIGTYHRYCNIYYKVLNMCFEMNDETFTIKNLGFKKYLYYSLTNFIPGNSKIKFLKNYTYLNYTLFDKPNLRIKNISNLKEKINVLINKNDFIFIHIPLPHSPWIYKDGKISSNNINQFDKTKENYKNNMILTDIFLKNILDEIKKKGIYENSSIIIASDHSWRERHDYIKPSTNNKIADKNIFLAVKNKKQTIGKKILQKTYLHDIYGIINKISNN